MANRVTRVRGAPVHGLAKMRAAIKKRLQAIESMVEQISDETILTDIHCNLDRDVQALLCRCMGRKHRKECLYDRFADKAFDFDGEPHSFYSMERNNG